MHSHEIKKVEDNIKVLVLILVVMEDALAQIECIMKKVIIVVLILVVMEDALARLKDF